jgi:hypothetical protein
MAVETLEACKKTMCSDYLTTRNTAMKAIEIQTGSNTFTLSFTTNNQDLKAIEGNIGNGQMDTSGISLVTASYWIDEENLIAETTFAFRE